MTLSLHSLASAARPWVDNALLAQLTIVSTKVLKYTEVLKYLNNLNN